MSDLTESFAKMINSRSRLTEDIPQGDVSDEKYLTFFEMGEGEDGAEGEPGEMEEGTPVPSVGLAGAAYASACLANDMKHIHLHAVGEQFDRVHELAGGYYDQAGEDTDLLAEMALECGEEVNNLGFAAENIDWELVTATSFAYDEAIQVMSSCVSNFLIQLDTVANLLDGDKKSEVEVLQRYWHKELEYKLVRR